MFLPPTQESSMSVTLTPTTEMQLIHELGVDYKELSLSLVFADTEEPGRFQFLYRRNMDERKPLTDAQARAIIDIFTGILDDAA